MWNARICTGHIRACIQRFSPLGSLALHYEVVTNGKLSEENGFKGAANGPVWMPQALISLCLIHIWSWVVGRIPPSHDLSSGVIRNGHAVWRWTKWKITRTKVAKKAANGTVWMFQALKSPCLVYMSTLESEQISLLIRVRSKRRMARRFAVWAFSSCDRHAGYKTKVARNDEWNCREQMFWVYWRDESPNLVTQVVVTLLIRLFPNWWLKSWL